MKRPLSLAVATAAVLAVGCSEDGGSAGGSTSASTPASGEESSPTPSPSSASPSPRDVEVEDLAGGWLPVDMGDGVYNLIIEANGDADSVGSPGPYSALDEDEICFGSIERGDQSRRFRIELDCHLLADLEGPGESYRGTATVESPASAGSLLDCEEQPGVLVITWDHGDEDVLCRTGET